MQHSADQHYKRLSIVAESTDLVRARQKAVVSRLQPSHPYPPAAAPSAAASRGWWRQGTLPLLPAPQNVFHGHYLGDRGLSAVSSSYVRPLQLSR